MTIVYHPEITNLSVVKNTTIHEKNSFVAWLMMLNNDQKLLDEFKKHMTSKPISGEEFTNQFIEDMTITTVKFYI
jgi:hypothetical protein